MDDVPAAISDRVRLLASYARYATNLVLQVDPTLIQFRLSCRVLLSIACVSLALTVVNRFLHLSEAAIAIALMTALQGTVAVRDETAWGRAVTRFYSVIAGFSVICVITFFDRDPVAVDSILLGVIFFAAYAPRYGERWKAVGIFTFFCCILSGFLKPVDSELFGVGTSLIVSAMISHVVRNFVLPERPADDFRRAVRALNSLTLAFTREIRRCASLRHPKGDLNKLYGIRSRARNALMHAEEYLSLEADEAAAALSGRLYDLDLAFDRGIMKVALASSQPGDITHCLGHLDQIRREIMRSVSEIPDSTFTNPLKAKPVSKAAADAQLRQAVQITLASAIALIFGLWLSQERWFWAVMTAFIVFMNTHSTGQTSVRAFNRILGTAVGIIAGIVLATALHGSLVPSILLTAVALAFGFFIMAVSYATFCICLTIAISLVYGLVGAFTPHLLVLRLEETAIGAAAGVFVSMLVFPTRTDEHLSNAFRMYLQRIDTLLSLFCNPAYDAVAITAQLRMIETAHADCRRALPLLGSAWKLGLKRSGTRDAVLRLNILQYSIELLARTFATTAPTPDQAARIAELRSEIQAIGATNIDLLSPGVPADPNEVLKTEDAKEADITLQQMMVVLHQLDPKRIRSGERDVANPNDWSKS